MKTTMSLLCCSLLSLLTIATVASAAEPPKTGGTLTGVFTGSASSGPIRELRPAFDSWRISHGIVYETEAEMERRLEIFSENLWFVEEWNSHPERHRVALNRFADLTGKEFKKLHIMNRPDINEISTQPALAVEGAIVDWRNKNAVGPVREMGQSGSSVAIAVAESVEGCGAIAAGHLITLSADQINTCAPNRMPQDTWAYVVKAGGLPKQGETAQCFGGKWAVNVTGFKQVTSGSEAALEAAVNITTPQVAIDASHPSFQFYAQGIYYEPACSTTNLDSALLVVGYGTTSGEDYWIVKNSWGTAWGLGGYILMSRNRNNNCGIATLSFYGTGCVDNS